MEANINGENAVDNERTHLHVNMSIKWRNVVMLFVIHAMALYGLILIPFAHWKTILFNIFYNYVGGFGVTGGAHRLWTHKSYKAKLPLKIILMIAYMSAGMNPIFEWVRDHRVHHKYSETDADPHNAKRGLFFSHVGWLMVKKHPEVLRRGREIDMTDIVTDCVVAFQRKFYIPMLIFFCFVLPVFIPCYYWCESFSISWFINVFRWVSLINCIWSVNSFAHIYGYRPYNRNIQPAENLFVAILSMGEGWHNYHHTFPFDYKVAEFGIYRVNIATALIDMFAAIGWAYDRKQPSREMIEEFVRKSGDGSHRTWGHMKEVPKEVQNEE